MTKEERRNENGKREGIYWGGIGQKLTAPPQLREIKHCATVFHPGASAKRKAALRHGHARAPI